MLPRYHRNLILYEPIYGAYTELFAGLSPEVKMEQAEAYDIPWGRIAVPKMEITDAMKSKKEGDRRCRKVLQLVRL
jgi:retinol dehydrogenase-12